MILSNFGQPKYNARYYEKDRDIPGNKQLQHNEGTKPGLSISQSKEQESEGMGEWCVIDGQCWVSLAPSVYVFEK